MSRPLPPLDLHAHIDPTTHPADLEQLGAVVFAATRSLKEYESTRNRRDQVTIWGLGCHPGVPEAQSTYNPDRFAALLHSAAYVSEVGLDKRSKVPMAAQMQVLSSIFECLQDSPRIVSIHSSGSSERVLDALERDQISGAVLHWWRGDASQTRRAIDLGCWFSVNAAGMKFSADVAAIPLGRIFTETDHPSGDRGAALPRQPGAVKDVEAGLAVIHGTSPTIVRQQIWSNFGKLVDEVDGAALLPRPVQRMLNVTGNKR